MALIPAPSSIVMAALNRAVQLNLSAGSVTRALNRAGFSVRGLGVASRVRTATARRSQREILARLRGNAKPRLGSGMSERPHGSLTRYSYVGEIRYRLPTGKISTRVQSVLSNELLTKSQAERLLLSLAEQLRSLGRATSSGVSELNAVPIRADLVEAEHFCEGPPPGG